MRCVSALAPSLRAYLFSALHSIDHVKITRDEMHDTDPDDKY